jgi:hypothetical protein
MERFVMNELLMTSFLFHGIGRKRRTVQRDKDTQKGMLLFSQYLTFMLIRSLFCDYEIPLSRRKQTALARAVEMFLFHGSCGRIPIAFRHGRNAAPLSHNYIHQYDEYADNIWRQYLGLLSF